MLLNFEAILDKLEMLFLLELEPLEFGLMVLPFIVLGEPVQLLLVPEPGLPQLLLLFGHALLALLPPLGVHLLHKFGALLLAFFCELLALQDQLLLFLEDAISLLFVLLLVLPALFLQLLRLFLLLLLDLELPLPEQAFLLQLVLVADA